jgi:hypothetical protein
MKIKITDWAKSVEVRIKEIQDEITQIKAKQENILQGIEGLNNKIKDGVNPEANSQIMEIRSLSESNSMKLSSLERKLNDLSTEKSSSVDPTIVENIKSEMHTLNKNLTALSTRLDLLEKKQRIIIKIIKKRKQEAVKKPTKQIIKTAPATVLLKKKLATK